MTTRSALPSNTKRVTRGASWIYFYRWIDRLLGFVSIAVLARILSEEDFGLVAVAASYVAIVEGLSEFDVNKALIQSRDPDRRLLDSAWTLSALRGLLAAVVMVSVGSLLSDERLTPILLVLALAPVLDGLANPRFVMFERDLVFSRLAVLTLTAKLASFAVTLVVALVLRSYWALVLGIVTSSFVSTVLSYVLKSYRPRVSLKRGREILSFSGWMTLATVVSTLALRTDRIIIEKFLGFASAGVYYMTERIGVLPTSELISPLQRVLFPAFSQVAERKDRLAAVVSESISVLGSLSLPAAVGFALTANDFVPLFLGDRWLAIVPLLWVYVPFLGLRSTLSMARPCVMALGQTKLMFQASWVYAVVHLPVFIAGTALYELEGAIWAIVIAGLFYFYLNAWLLKKTVSVTLGEVFRQLRRPVLAVVAMTAVIAALQFALPMDLFSERGSWVSLLLKAVVGAGVFCAALLLLWQIEGRPPGIERRALAALRRG